MDRTTIGHVYNGILLGHKKEENFTLAMVWTDLENIMLSEISQAERDKCCMISLICGISQTELALTSKAETDS